jgi:lipoprotein LprG
MGTTTRWLSVSCTAMLLASAAASCGGDDAEPEGEPLPAEAGTVLAAASTSMGAVTSVRFHLERSGAPVFIDEFDSIQLDEVDGRYEAPSSADAVLDVTINGSDRATLGAVALDGDVWLSNPITGTFEPLSSAYDIDPAAFIDPVNGWRPLLAELQDAELVGEEDRDGTRYHVRGTAGADRMQVITAGLVDQELTIDFWLRRDTGLVTASEFTTTFEGQQTNWVLELREYGEDFDIKRPDLDG